jgi:hypothetical protein
MIYIDFQAGSHGNYLEFACNRHLANIPTSRLPFGDDGAAHVKPYLIDPVFKAWHYSNHLGNRTELTNSKIISIHITPDDLLQLIAICFLRAGSTYNFDCDHLEKNTYHKLNTPMTEQMLDHIIKYFFKNQVRDSYNAVKDSTWPEVTTLQEFNYLPPWIHNECIAQHNLNLMELSESSPDCPRHILRDYFTEGFHHPANSVFIKEQQELFVYDKSNEVHKFPYSSFYNTEKFITEFKKLEKFTGYEIVDYDQLLILHREFLKRQPYKDSKINCDKLFESIVQKNKFPMPSLGLLEESYLGAQLEMCYNKKLDFLQDTWFTHSNQIHEYFGVI